MASSPTSRIASLPSTPAYALQVRGSSNTGSVAHLPDSNPTPRENPLRSPREAAWAVQTAAGSAAARMAPTRIARRAGAARQTSSSAGGQSTNMGSLPSADRASSAAPARLHKVSAPPSLFSRGSRVSAHNPAQPRARAQTSGITALPNTSERGAKPMSNIAGPRSHGSPRRAATPPTAQMSTAMPSSVSVRATGTEGEARGRQATATAQAYRGNSLSTGWASPPVQSSRGWKGSSPWRTMLRAIVAVSHWRMW